MKPIDWDIRREGRLWSDDEFDQRLYQAPEKIEVPLRRVHDEAELVELLGDWLAELRRILMNLRKRLWKLRKPALNSAGVSFHPPS
jgi:hypothetical protein